MRLIRNSASQTSGHKGGDAMRQAPRHFVTWVALSAANGREYVIVLEPVSLELAPVSAPAVIPAGEESSRH